MLGLVRLENPVANLWDGMAVDIEKTRFYFRGLSFSPE